LEPKPNISCSVEKSRTYQGTKPFLTPNKMASGELRLLKQSRHGRIEN